MLIGNWLLFCFITASLAGGSYQAALRSMISKNARHMKLNLRDADMVSKAISAPIYCRLNSNVMNAAEGMSELGQNSIKTTVVTFLQALGSQFLNVTQDYINKNPLVFTSFSRDVHTLKTFLNYLGFYVDTVKRDGDITVQLTTMPGFSIDSFCDPNYSSSFNSFVKSQLNPSQTSAIVSYVSNVKHQMPLLMDYLLSVSLSQNVQRLTFLPPSDMRIIKESVSPILNDFYRELAKSANLDD
jgi:hypothetical protein